MILCISVVSVVTSPFSFLILFIWVLSLFFLMSLVKVLSIFSKNHLLDSLILWIVILVSMPFNSALILVIFFFYLLWALFVVVLPVLVGIVLGCLFEMFLSFLGKPVSL